MGKKPLTEEQVYDWIKYSFKGLAMARRLCKRKGYDFKRLTDKAMDEAMEEVFKIKNI